jgi:hypothetical protein
MVMGRRIKILSIVCPTLPLSQRTTETKIPPNQIGHCYTAVVFTVYGYKLSSGLEGWQFSK